MKDAQDILGERIKMLEVALVNAQRGMLAHAALSHNVRRMLRALDGYEKVMHDDEPWEGDLALAWFQTYEKYRAQVEKLIG